MNIRELKRLRRRDLLEMLLDLTKENEQLCKINKQLEAVIEDRTITQLEAGTLAEAALRLNGVFQAARMPVTNTHIMCRLAVSKWKRKPGENVSGCSLMRKIK